MTTARFLDRFQCLALALALLLPLTPASAEEVFRGYSQPFIPQATERQVPDIPFVTAEGEARRLSDYRGEVVVVNFWASWCGACLTELASLGRLRAAVATEGIRVLTLNQDLNDPNRIHQVLESRGAGGLPSHRDGNSLLGVALGQTLLPTTLIIDRQGRVAGQLVGAAEWDSPEALRLVRSF